MLSQSHLTHALLALLVGGFLMSSCQEDMKEYYEEPDWIKGSIYEILQDAGNYSIFLQGVDICDYTSLMKGRNILTVMAPDDDAMRTYLQAHYATTDISTLPQSEVKKIVGFHILYYNFDKQKLTNFRPNEGDGATEEELAINAGLYYKFRTRSQDAIEENKSVIKVMTNGVIDSTEVKIDVFHYERFLPIFSYRMFQTYLLDAKYNYEYFFPETPWKGNADEACFNVANAALTQNDPDLAKNGTLYYVDRVLEPMGTIHDALEQNSNYTMFLDFYDENQYWSLDADASSIFGDASRALYVSKYLNGYPNIAQEWTASNSLDIARLAMGGMSIFAPTNEAYNQFYKDYWGFEGTGWPLEVSWDTVRAEAPNAINYLMQNCYNSNLAFPEQITKGEILNSDKIAISFDVDAVPAANRKFCVNGVVYGLSVLTPPAALGSVTGPTFQYRRFSNFASMVGNDVLKSLGETTDVKYIMLYPSNSLLANNGIELRPDLGTGLYRGSDRFNDGANMANAHIIRLTGGSDALPSDAGYHVYNTYTTSSGKHRLYLYVHDGKVTNCYLFDQLLQYSGSPEVTEDNLYANVEELTFRGESWSNGRCYEYDTENYKRLLESSLSYLLPSTSFTTLMSSHQSDDGTLFQGFISVLKAADLLDVDGTINFLTSTEDYIMFIPTSEAIKTAILEGKFGTGKSSAEPFVTVPEGTTADDPDFWNKIVITDAARVMCNTNFNRLQCYLQEYFLPDETYGYTEYPFVGYISEGEVAGDPVSSVVDLTSTPASNTYIYISDNGSKLSIQVGTMEGANGHSIDVIDQYHYLPFIFDDGCVHFINGVLDNVWPYENY